MDNPEGAGRRPGESLLPRPYRLMRRLVALYGGAAGLIVVLLALAAVPATLMSRTHALAADALANGLGALMLAPLLLALSALTGTLLLTIARSRHALAPPALPGARTRWTLGDPGFTARQGQALVMSIGAVLVLLAVRLMWPAAAIIHSQAHHASADNVIAVFVFGLAFVSLMAERLVNDFPAPQLPEAPALRRILLLVTVLLAVAGCVQIAHSLAVGWIRWVAIVVLWVTALVVLELASRALARLFLPPPPAADARAVADSILVALLTGGPRAPGHLLRTHFGLDFARSWALGFLSRAFLPAVFGTALLCWGLSGLKLIDLAHRGVYERFGAPVAVLGPGLHLLLPWPLGRLRSVEYGAIHSVAIGVGSAADTPASGGPAPDAIAQVSDQQVDAALEQIAAQQELSFAQLPATFAAEGIDYTQYREQLRREIAARETAGGEAATTSVTPYVSAEATPPLSLNRLWTTVHADQAHYLVASLGTGEQGFQTVDTEIFVLYRVGLTNQAALQSTYTVIDPAALVRDCASRLVLRYFHSRTLEEVLGARREDVAGTLRTELAHDIATYQAGIDIVSVLIEEIHPPSGAAQAYHAVQAAQINANASIANERGRAQRTAGVARQEAHELIAAADAQAVETRDAASATAYRFNADRKAYGIGGRSFVLERLYGDLTTALRGKPLTIMDGRLNASEGPFIDMRPGGTRLNVGPQAAGPPSMNVPAPPYEMEPAFSTAD